MKFTIKSSYLTLTGAALLLSACSESDGPLRDRSENEQIVFRSSLPALTSRSAVTTTENLGHFYVTGFDAQDPERLISGRLEPLFGNQRVDIVEGKDIYTSANCMWPRVGRESEVVTFFAFSPALNPGDGSELMNRSALGAVDYTLDGFRIAPDIADQVDFIAAHTKGTMERNLFSGIHLPFEHKLCRVNVKAWGKHKSCDIEIAGVRFGGVYKKANFNFRDDYLAPGYWTDLDDKGTVEYIFDDGDYVVSIKNNNPANHTIDGAQSIMGNTQPDGNNAMLLPTTYSTPWGGAADGKNTANGLYISVLLRITDVTPSAGKNDAPLQRFPYVELSQGADALSVEREYLAVETATNKVRGRVYKNPETGVYCSDAKCEQPFSLPAGQEIREYGWAAVPITGVWEAGYIYTYTLDYSTGVGLLDPEVTTGSPAAGDPVISDRVGITYSVKEWLDGGGDQFVVPGS